MRRTVVRIARKNAFGIHVSGGVDIELAPHDRNSESSQNLLHP